MLGVILLFPRLILFDKILYSPNQYQCCTNNYKLSPRGYMSRLYWYIFHRKPAIGESDLSFTTTHLSLKDIATSTYRVIIIYIFKKIFLMGWTPICPYGLLYRKICRSFAFGSMTSNYQLFSFNPPQGGGLKEILNFFLMRDYFA